MSNSSMVFSMLRQNELVSRGERQSNDSEFETEGEVTMKAFLDYASAMGGNRSTDSRPGLHGGPKE